MKWGINKDFAKLAAILAAVAVVSFGMERILAYVFYGKDSFYWGRYLGIFVVLELAACLVCFREIVARNLSAGYTRLRIFFNCSTASLI